MDREILMEGFKDKAHKSLGKISAVGCMEE